MSELNIPLLKNLCEIPGAPGFESRIRNMIIEELKDIVDDYSIDTMGNLITVLEGSEDKTVALSAHMDEISFIVTHIDSDGFVRFHTLGGFDPKTLTAQRVIIHGKEKIIGVMGTKPVHLMTAEEKKKPLTTKEFFIDTGYSKEQLEGLIDIGDPITRERELIELGDCVNSKSIDNRVSVFVLIEALKALAKTNRPYKTLGIFTVQEEVGVRGAATAANGLDPDFSIVIDTTVANDLPGASGHEKITHLGKGAAIKIMDGMTICDQRMVSFMKSIAQKNHIDYQMEILPAGGTDTAAFQRNTKGGSIAGAISIPTRYLHQVIEMANKGDIQKCIELLTECTSNIAEYNWKYE